MKRRQFLKQLVQFGTFACAGTLAGCGENSEFTPTDESVRSLWEPPKEVILYDTYLMATYFDGTTGPRTGILKVDYILQDDPVELEFWHGHAGRSHYFTLTPDHFSQVKQLKKTFVQTTEVAAHSHKLFVDPTDPRYRVPGAQPIPVPI